ncbi:SDR family NAD(P)-dependent oxidoreductase [Botrimarina mediterranea]|uniref:3-oxoacyl-[acyl-carrier-protein] reductase FabG n=1 Tax=Botrimarina mediterranea TaxID=2528022 RepID=A0A518KAE6_9BACT|nr:3-oxoacyl-ACP reductase family protein [Botrimarina mediterranea]QDV74761.1 3-oxoacyl-[acyl-carrier-protein] reductase FabG [Botrimarina mediterranea]QDV79406.1 3-oxoacyl-[acyl-carrier-protein] reductase FabG [Planctomycetes bacterium K2D]
MTELSNRTALVTGSTRGLGKRIALELARRGARVAMNYYGNQEVAAKAFAELQAIGGEHCLVRADVTEEAGVADLLGEIESKIGPVDILVPNATCDQPMTPIEEYDWAFAQRMVDFFIKSPFLLTKACVPHMKRQGWGRIVHITSEVFDGAWPNFCPYVAAKGGQIGLAKSNAAEFAPHGITVNMVAPGWIPVERHEDAPQEAKDEYLALAPMGRFGKPEDVAAAVAYFASDDAKFVTGVSLSVNGGRTIH